MTGFPKARLVAFMATSIPLALASACGSSLPDLRAAIGDCVEFAVDADSPEEIDPPAGLSFVCGTIETGECIGLTSDGEIEADGDGSVVEYLGDSDELRQTSLEDCAALFTVWASSPLEIPADASIRLEGQDVIRGDG